MENLPYYVRPMCEEDIDQVTDIDHEAFSTQWPPPNFKHELRNHLNHHIVACEEETDIDKFEVEALPKKDSNGLASRLRRLFGRQRSLSNEPPPHRSHVVGFTSLWVMADEAHITNIAVRESYRRQGIGELLLISAIGLAAKLNTRIVTLEVRISNIAAQSLYTKYGFNPVGVRRGYYLDNKEDALLMSTPDITSTAFRARLQQLKQVHSQKR